MNAILRDHLQRRYTSFLLLGVCTASGACRRAADWGENPLRAVTARDSVITVAPFPELGLTEEFVYDPPPGGLGLVTSIVALPDGSIYVYDARSPKERKALYDFGGDGQLIRRVGSAGIEPGEYSSSRPVLTALSGGGALVADPSALRSIVFDSLGEVLVNLQGLKFGGPRFVADRRNGFWLKEMRLLEGESSAIWVRYSAAGVSADTAALPVWASTPRGYATFFPHLLATVDEDGHSIAVWTGALSVIRDKGSGPVLSAAALPPVHYNPTEHADLQRIMVFELKGARPPSGVPESIPSRKPVVRELIGLDRYGNLWLLLSAPSYRDPEQSVVAANLLPPGMPGFPWVEPDRIGSFDPAGRFRGWITLPRGTSFMEAQGNVVWGTRLSNSDEVEVVRWVISGLP